jgi:NAD(P)-dependent dehydrogenase (short-subunit alcohol dehydrogenase family)
MEHRDAVTDSVAAVGWPPGQFSLAGKSVLITGATGALGSAAARALAKAGALLTLAGGSAGPLNELAADLRETRPGAVVAVPLRPDTPENAAAMVKAAVQAHGGLHGVLAASGMNHVAPITSMDVTDFQRVQDANVRGSWLVCQAAGRQLIEQGQGGSVVLVSSTRGRLGHPAGYSAYCASKAAVDLLAKSLAAEWGPAGIRVNAIAPTVFRSALTAWMYEEDERGRATREAMLARIPLGRLAEPEDLVGPLQFLLSDASAFITGQVLYLDGGYTAC